jgi:hypothetical protein
VQFFDGFENGFQVGDRARVETGAVVNDALVSGKCRPSPRPSHRRARNYCSRVLGRMVLPHASQTDVLYGTCGDRRVHKVHKANWIQCKTTIYLISSRTSAVQAKGGGILHGETRAAASPAFSTANEPKRVGQAGHFQVPSRLKLSLFGPLALAPARARLLDIPRPRNRHGVPVLGSAAPDMLLWHCAELCRALRCAVGEPFISYVVLNEPGQLVRSTFPARPQDGHAAALDAAVCRFEPKRPALQYQQPRSRADRAVVPDAAA